MTKYFSLSMKCPCFSRIAQMFCLDIKMFSSTNCWEKKNIFVSTKMFSYGNLMAQMLQKCSRQQIAGIFFCLSTKMFSYGNLVARESQWGVERDWASRQSLSYFYRDRSMTSKSYLRHISINLVQHKI